jgi:DNA polymerase III epsilon subunit-like protein
VEKFFQTGLVPTYCDIAKNGIVVVVDTETTGLSNHDDVVQLAVVVMVKGEEKLLKEFYIRNQVPLNGTEAQTINGLTDEYLAEYGMDPKEVFQDFITMLKWYMSKGIPVMLVGHNLSFDYRMISNMLQRHGIEPIPHEIVMCCTKSFVKALNMPKTFMPNSRLCSCVEAFNLKGENSHDAMDDAKACMELLKLLTD